MSKSQFKSRRLWQNGPVDLCTFNTWTCMNIAVKDVDNYALKKENRLSCHTKT